MCLRNGNKLILMSNLHTIKYQDRFGLIGEISYVWPLNLFHQILIALHAQHIQNKNQDHFSHPRTIGRVGFKGVTNFSFGSQKLSTKKTYFFISANCTNIASYFSILPRATGSSN